MEHTKSKGTTEKPELSETEIWLKLKNDRQVNKVYAEVPHNKLVKTIDVSLKGKGFKEDKAYAESNFYRKYVRRGNSYIELMKDPNNPNDSEVFLGRKGFEKFFDLRLEYIEHNLDPQSALKLKKQDRDLYWIIFNGVERTFKKGGKVSLYKTMKENGENAQITYVKRLDSWLIASKNVSILVRNRDEVNSYVAGGKRYYFALLIADCWFKKLEKLSPDQIIALKQDIEGLNLIGEYVGNPLHQHLVEYKEIDVIFYAIVDLKSNDSCIPVLKASEIFDKYGFKKVNIELRGTYEDEKSFNEALLALYKEVSESELEKDQEGAVLYFQSIFPDGECQVLSLSKLKTLEYRVLRKLREKLKNQLRDMRRPEDVVRTYKKEIQELSKTFKTPKPIDHYVEIATKALEFVTNNSKVARSIDISSRYIDFLKIVQANQKLEPSLFEKIMKNPNEKGPESDEEEEADGQEESKQEEKKPEENQAGSNPSEEFKSEHKQPEENIPTYPVKAEYKRIVIISHPLLIPNETIETIRSSLKLSGIDTIWNENIENKASLQLSHIHMFPRISKNAASELLQYNTYFIVVGFDKENKNLEISLQNLENAAKNKTPVPQSVFAMVQSKTKKATLENLQSKAEEFKTTLSELLPNNFKSVENLNFSDPQGLLDLCKDAASHLQKFTSAKKTVEKAPQVGNGKRKLLIMIPLGIPAMGKTTFIKTLKEVLTLKGGSISVVSSDVVRKEIIDNLRSLHPDWSEDKLFDSSTKKAKVGFDNRVKETINSLDPKEPGAHLLFLDKNHPPERVTPAIEALEEMKLSQKFDVRYIAVLPKCLKGLKTYRLEFPFSATFLLNCLKRAINREGHETLQGNEIKVGSVVLMFFKLYKGFKLKMLQQYGLHHYIELPFTYEDAESDEKIPEHLRELLYQAIDNMRPNDAQFLQNQEVIEFLKEFLKLDLQFKQPDSKVLYDACVEQLNSCFGLF